MRDSKAGLGLACLSLAVVACGSADRSSVPVVERIDSAGTEIVVNHGPDASLDWTFDSLYAIGGAPDVKVASQITETGVASDAAGRIYVLDGFNGHIAVFDRSGQFQRTFGRKGEGPGEFGDPISLAISNDTISVLDRSLPGLVRFDTAGAVLDPVRIEKPNLRWGLEHLNDGVLFTWFDYRRDEETSFDRLTWTGAGEYRNVAAIPSPTPDPVSFPSCGVAIPLGPLFAPELVWAAGDGRVAVSSDPEYSLDVYRSGRRIQMIRRSLPPQEITRERALKHWSDGWSIGLGSGQCTVPPEQVVDGRGFAPELQGIAGVQLSPVAELWVKRRAIAGQEEKVDVFERDGTYVGTLPPDAPYPVAFIGPNRLAAIETDAVDVRRLIVYHVHRSET